MIQSWKERTELLIGRDKIERIEQAHVLVVGLGGVGAMAAEMIARAGVGKMTIVDADLVSETNLNRQIVALRSTIGKAKADILHDRLLDINPDLQITVIKEFIKDDATATLLNSASFDYVVDCIDTLSPKVNLIIQTLQLGIPLVSSMGAGAKVDPTKIEVKDIGKTHHCPLAHMLRKRLHKEGVRSGFLAVFSSEDPITSAMILVDEQNKKSNVGTFSYLPAAFGCAVASAVLRHFAEI